MRIHNIKDYPMKLAIQGCRNYSLQALDALMELCAETDIRLKSSPVDGYILIERLLCALTGRYESEIITKENY